MTKYFSILLIAVFAFGLANAQKVNYKNNIINVDGKDIGKVNRIKDAETFGLISTYELFAMGGKKLIIAAYASEYDRDHSTNMTYYYRFTFLTTNQVGIFSLSKLGPEKSFANLVGESGIMVNDELDSAKIKEFIAMKGKDPSITVKNDDYIIARRDKGWPVKLKADKTIEQNSVIIGSFKDVTSPSNSYDTYEINLPSGIIAVKMNFVDGNNTQAFDIVTMKDHDKRTIKIPTSGKVFAASADADRNQIALARIIKWLIANGYL